MLPHTFLGILLTLLVIVGGGYTVHLATKFLKTPNGEHALAYYAFLLIFALIHPIGAAIAILCTVAFIIKGNAPAKVAATIFIVVFLILLLLPHLFLVFKF